MPSTAWMIYVPAVRGPQPLEAAAAPPPGPVASTAAEPSGERLPVWEPAARSVPLARVPAARPRRRH